MHTGTGFAEGIDLYIEKRLSETPFYGRLTLSYGESMFKALDGVSRPSNNDQRWKLNIGCGYIINDRWEATSTFRFYTGIPYTPYTEGTFNRLVSDYNSARVGVNHSLDLRVAASIWIFRTSITVKRSNRRAGTRQTAGPNSRHPSASCRRWA